MEVAMDADADLTDAALHQDIDMAMDDAPPSSTSVQEGSVLGRAKPAAEEISRSDGSSGATRRAIRTTSASARRLVGLRLTL